MLSSGPLLANAVMTWLWEPRDEHRVQQSNSGGFQDTAGRAGRDVIVLRFRGTSER